MPAGRPRRCSRCPAGSRRCAILVIKGGLRGWCCVTCELGHIASVLEGGQYRYPQRDCTPVPASVSRIVTESGPAVGHRGPHRLQHLLSRAVWDDRQVLNAAAAWAVTRLDDGDAVLVVDDTADEKSSADAVGAARQYCGTVGGIALCQVAVTLTFATSRGHALLDRALYLPGACAADEEHRELAGVPEEVMFATKPELAGRCCSGCTSRGSALAS
jgi:hypothetical protein